MNFSKKLQAYFQDFCFGMRLSTCARYYDIREVTIEIMIEIISVFEGKNTQETIRREAEKSYTFILKLNSRKTKQWFSNYLLSQMLVNAIPRAIRGYERKYGCPCSRNYTKKDFPGFLW